MRTLKTRISHLIGRGYGDGCPSWTWPTTALILTLLAIALVRS